jgi:FtsP/CotA-like multicopper oxidase with cupredoxin domain
MASPTRKLSALAATLVVAFLAATPPASAQPIVPASAPGTVQCTTGPNFELTAGPGRISTPDGNSIFMWGYGITGGRFQMPGPVLCVNEGDVVTVTLTNSLSEPTSIVFPGQADVTATGGSPGLLAQEAAPSGGTVQYTFTANRPGTFLYESGSTPSKQIEMGLYGALIVRPALGANYAYDDPATEFDPEREYLILLHDIDPYLHQAVERGQPFDITTKHDHYWTVNGRSFPDSIADSFVPWLPNQPYGSLVWVEIDGDPPALIRYANAGLSNHPFHPHGNNLNVIARDGTLLRGPSGEDGSHEAFAKTIGSGQTYDLTFGFENDESYSSGNPVRFDGSQVIFPGLLNTVFKDGLSFYSGSPYLGQEDDLPPAVTRLNECGEFYYPWHSHALNEFQNFDEGFGGLATLLRVDPPGGCPEPNQAPVNVVPPTISGIAIETQTLTGTDGEWTGTDPIDYTRQWQRLVGGDWVDIPGATDSTYVLAGADVDTQVRLCVTATNAFGSATACSSPTATVAGTLRLSFTDPALGTSSIGGVAFADEDIVSFNGTSFSMLFDGSDPLTAATDIDAFAFLDEDSIIMSFTSLLNATAVPGVGIVTDADIVRFDATSLGTSTTGSFSMVFDASDVGLSPSLLNRNEGIDAIQQLPGGELVISTSGDPDVPGITGEASEDLLLFTPTSLGASTAGTWSMRFDGSDVGLAAGSENVDSAWTAGNGDIYLSTTGDFSVPGLSGDDDDVFVFTPASLGTTTAGSFSPALQFNAGSFGQGGNDVDGAGRRGEATITPAAFARAIRPAARVVKVGATAKVRGRTLTVSARTVRCKPCWIRAKVKPEGRKVRTLKMKRYKGRYRIAARKLPRGQVTYWAVVRDRDSRRAARSVAQVAQIGPAVAVSLDLCADESSLTLPGAGVIPIWGFSNCARPATTPGPQLVVNEGDDVTVNLTNNLEPATGQNVSLVFPGQTLASDMDGAAPGGGTATYTFTADEPGVYLYESGVNAAIQRPMGLHGAIVVRPSLDPTTCGAAAGVAYNDCSTAFDVERVLVLSEIDPALNTSADPSAFDPLAWHPTYWLINGEAYPDVPAVSAAPGARVALRYLNAGQEHHTMTLLGLRQRLVASDSFQPLVRPALVAETIATGATADAIATVPAAAPGTAYPLYSRQLDVTNGPSWPGGMLTFITVSGP